MDKLERFKQLSDAMPMETKLELYQAEVSELIKTIDVDEEFDDVELDAIGLCNLFIDDLQCFAGRTNGLQACCD